MGYGAVTDERVVEFSVYARVPADQEEELTNQLHKAVEQLLCPEGARGTHGESHECRWPWTLTGSSRPFDQEHEDWIASVEEEVDSASAVIWHRRRKERGLPERGVT